MELKEEMAEKITQLIKDYPYLCGEFDDVDSSNVIRFARSLANFLIQNGVTVPIEDKKDN